MKSTRILLLVLLFLPVIFAANTSTSYAQNLPPEVKSEKVMPQSEPFITLLKAIKSSDPQLLKTAFSTRMIKIFEEKNTWEEVLNTYTNAFQKQFGNYKLEDFAYDFIPDDKVIGKAANENGRLKITVKGKDMGGMKIIREAESEQWKLNER